MDKIRVLIVDDHEIVRKGLCGLLENEADVEVVGEAAGGEEAVRMVGDLRPDVVMMDITMPVMSGLDATEKIKAAHPQVKVLCLTMHERDEYFFKMLSAGASGYFVKGGSCTELMAALRTVSRGDVYIYPTMAKRLVGDYLKKTAAADANNGAASDGLTLREREILKLVAEGYTNQEIAERLFVTPATVQTHRANVMAKLGLHSRTELVKFAIRHGFIVLDT